MTSIELPGPLIFGEAVVQAMSRRSGAYIEQTNPRTVSDSCHMHAIWLKIYSHRQSFG